MNSLPVVYKHQANVWMNSEIFFSWFHNEFAPFIQLELINMGQEAKALLLIDNCSAHPPENVLTSEDGKIKAKFLPPNVTSLIQPMDQGVIEYIKRRYRKGLLRSLLFSTEKPDTITFLKSINILHVIERISTAWNEVPFSIIKSSWKELLQTPDNEIMDSFTPSTPLSPSLNTEFIKDFHHLGFALLESDIISWMEKDRYDICQHLTEIEIIKAVTEYYKETDSLENDEEGNIVANLHLSEEVSNVQAMDMFDKCLGWLRLQAEATPSNISVLLSLKELAASKINYDDCDSD